MAKVDKAEAIVSIILATISVYSLVEFAAKIKNWYKEKHYIGEIEKYNNMDFDWDAGNEYHLFEENKSRGYTKEIIESVFEDENAILYDIIGLYTEKRFKIVGLGNDKKLHNIVFCERNNYIRPITAFPISNKAKKLYYEGIKNSTNRI